MAGKFDAISVSLEKIFASKVLVAHSFVFYIVIIHAWKNCWIELFNFFMCEMQIWIKIIQRRTYNSNNIIIYSLPQKGFKAIQFCYL